MFSDQTVLLREICNGIMCVSAVMLAVIFAHYIVARLRKDHEAMKDSVVQAAIALLLLMIGHSLRAFSGWMQFLWLRHNWSPEYWANGVELFLVATALIVLAKALMVYTFAPLQWGWRLALLALMTVVAIPIAVAVVTG